ncbi:MAG: hypothetical protein FK731_03225 [Asgard group archaeon]|nr:hypothetical protein [Asgard group archaeon]
MRNSTFHDIAEIASKQYNKDARKMLENQLNYFMREYDIELIKQLGLPQVLMFISSATAKSNRNEVITSSDVQDAFSFLRYIITRDLLENLIEKNKINLGLPRTEQVKGRLKELLKMKGDLKVKSNLDAKIERLKEFLLGHKLNQKHINRIEIELRATILLLARIIVIGKLKSNYRLTSQDIDISYDIVRFLMLKLDTLKLKILTQLYFIDNIKIWQKIPKMVFDQSTHDHLSNTAYADWESQLPDSFETLKKHLNCSSRPFIAAILGFSEIYGAKKGITRVSTEELLYILEDFELTIFGKLSPMIIEKRGVKISFTEEGLDLLAHISKWITNTIVNKFGKDEFVFNFSSTVPRQISLIFFISFVESIKEKDQKIDISHILSAITRWTGILKVLLLQTE